MNLWAAKHPVGMEQETVKEESKDLIESSSAATSE